MKQNIIIAIYQIVKTLYYLIMIEEVEKKSNKRKNGDANASSTNSENKSKKKKVVSKRLIKFNTIQSSVAEACDMSINDYSAIEKLVWQYFQQHMITVSSKGKKVQTLNESFLETFMSEISRDRYFLNSKLCSVNQNVENSLYELQTKLLGEAQLLMTPFINYILTNFPNYHYECNLLLSTPSAKAELNKHLDFVGKDLDTCFTVIVPINGSCNIILYDEHESENFQEYQIKCGQYLKFDGQRSYCAGMNQSKIYQFQLQLLFAKRESDLPPFVAISPVVETNSSVTK